MKRLVCVMMCLLTLVAVGSAGIVQGSIYDTITGVPTSGVAYVAFPPYYTGLAASFTTVIDPFTLTEVDLVLGYKGAPQIPNATGGLNIYLFSDSGTAPNSFVATIGTIADSAIGTTGEYSFTGLNLALANATRYWVGVFPQTGGTTSGWGLTLPAPAGSLGEYAYDTADGVYANTSSALQMRIVGDVDVQTPEPSTLLLAAFGIGAIGMWRRRSTAR